MLLSLMKYKQVNIRYICGRNILHHPLDNYGNYSACKTLADNLKIFIEKPAFLYCGALCGVIGTTGCVDDESDFYDL